MNPLSIGTRVNHPQYGKGIILDNTKSFYNVAFPNFGEKAIDKNFADLHVIELAPLPEERLSLGDVEKVLIQILRKWHDTGETVHLGSRWKGGTMILKPGDNSLKPKEIPIENFFHKIVMIRDRMRVLEQNINKSSNLSDEEKVNIQQYITRVYGSLTSFNVLFAHRDDYFVGDSKSE
ncbi:MAG: hypothetical protein SF052_11285 [Bacteroidia bacterium]|nr:hypothetical protein [Bacteroidia bacterium]